MSRKKKKQTPLVHLFSGCFESAEEADRWSQASDEGDSDESTCGFWEDVGCSSIDHDGQELIGGADRFDYLRGLLVDENDAAKVEADAPPGHNMLLLVFSYRDMNQGFEVTRRCETVKYHGGFPFDFYKGRSGNG